MFGQILFHPCESVSIRGQKAFPSPPQSQHLFAEIKRLSLKTPPTSLYVGCRRSCIR
jgi:hypothetical protein